MGGRDIPDRWLEYSAIGKKIEGTRFIAFKVPLRKSICDTVCDDRSRLGIEKILDVIPNLGLVIDLTNTYRYYDPDQFNLRGIQHVKIKVPGHVIPPIDLRKQFRKIVRDFLERNKHNDKLIGVHCTHGVNRTGFFICYHMVNDLGMEPRDAIRRFEVARGHAIERKNYIAVIYNNDADTSSRRREEEPERDHKTYKEYYNRDDTNKVSTSWGSVVRPDYPTHSSYHQSYRNHQERNNTEYRSNKRKYYEDSTPFYGHSRNYESSQFPREKIENRPHTYTKKYTENYSTPPPSRRNTFPNVQRHYDANEKTDRKRSFSSNDERSNFQQSSGYFRSAGQVNRNGNPFKRTKWDSSTTRIYESRNRYPPVPRNDHNTSKYYGQRR